MEKELRVGIGDTKFAGREGSIIAYALGPCIGIAFYDLFIYLGALLHTMPPLQFNHNDINAFKHADSGVRETTRKLTASGMVKPRTAAKIAGGAKMFEISGNADSGNIGTRNVASVEKIFLGEGMRIATEDAGGSYVRTMKLDLSIGSATIRIFGRPGRIL